RNPVHLRVRNGVAVDATFSGPAGGGAQASPTILNHPHPATTSWREVAAKGGPARYSPERARLMLRPARAALWWVLSSGDVDGLHECGLGDRGGDAVAHDGNDGGAAGEVAGERGAFDGVCP